MLRSICGGASTFPLTETRVASRISASTVVLAPLHINETANIRTGPDCAGDDIDVVTAEFQKSHRIVVVGTLTFLSYLFVFRLANFVAARKRWKNQKGTNASGILASYLILSDSKEREREREIEKQRGKLSERKTSFQWLMTTRTGTPPTSYSARDDAPLPFAHRRPPSTHRSFFDGILIHFAGAQHRSVPSTPLPSFTGFRRFLPHLHPTLTGLHWV